MKALFIFLFIIPCHLICFGQEVYYSSIAKLTDPYYRTVIGLFNLSDCSTQELYVDTLNLFTSYGEWGDIAICPDGQLYGLGHDGVYVIDINNQNHFKILDEPPYPRWDKGMTCTKDTSLIFGERDLLSFDIYDSILTYYGRIPSSLAIWANIFWYNGILMGSGNDDIIQIDTLDPLNSQIYCTLPITGLLSLTEVAISCDSTVIFAFYIGGEIYLFNPEDCSISYYCTLPKGPGESFQGSSPNFMYMPPEPCIVHLDLDAEDETIAGIDYLDTIFCELPSSFVFTQTDLYSDRSWDSLTIWIEQGPPGIYLESNIPPFATLTGQATNRLKFTSTTDGQLDELELYISSLMLAGEMLPGISTVKIGFAGWAGIRKSDTAYAYITLIGRELSSGTGQSIEVCSNADFIPLSDLLAPGADLNGVWKPMPVQSGIFSPSIDPSGIYFYIVNDPYCGPDSAVFELNTFPEPNLSIDSTIKLCPGDTGVLELNLPSAKLTWSDGSSGSSIQVTTSGIVWVDILDEYDCSYTDSIHIVLDENCLLDKIFVPNIFSPDGNGINDHWIIPPYPGVTSMEVTIFDRWGNALFNQKSESIQWNGETFDHEIIPQGVYAYYLEIETINSSRLVKTGDIMVLK